MLEAVRNIPGRRWNNDEKLWLLPHNQTVVNQLLKNLYATGLFNAKEKEKEKKHFCSNQTVPSGEKYIASQIRKVKEALTTRHYSEHTKTSYIKWIEDFLNINQGKQSIGEREINEYLKILALKKKVSASTQNQALAALLFYFRFSITLLTSSRLKTTGIRSDFFARITDPSSVTGVFWTNLK